MKNFNKTIIPNWLCFTANTASSTVKLQKNGSPTAVTIETSTDGNTWSIYTFNTAITLSNIGDKVYFRNTSETTTLFSLSASNYYSFVMTRSIAGSGDINYLVNKNSTDNISANTYYFYRLFYNCSSLTTPPELSATNLSEYCYQYMFSGCTNLTTTPVLPATSVPNHAYGYMFSGCSNLVTCSSLPATSLGTSAYRNMFYNCTKLETLPNLPALNIPEGGYRNMFYGCSKIKLSSSKTGAYQTSYRIPTTGTGSTGYQWGYNIFQNTGGTLTTTPSINTTIYTSNTLV